jgi:predicted deacylase
VTADDIKALVERLRNRAAKQDKEGDMHSMRKAADTLETFTQDIEALTLENQRLRVDADQLASLNIVAKELGYEDIWAMPEFVGRQS